jgi:hypothetical protein
MYYVKVFAFEKVVDGQFANLSDKVNFSVLPSARFKRASRCARRHLFSVELSKSNLLRAKLVFHRKQKTTRTCEKCGSSNKGTTMMNRSAIFNISNFNQDCQRKDRAGLYAVQLGPSLPHQV